MAEPVHGYPMEHDDEIDRRDSGLRLALTVLFVIVEGVLETVVAVIVVFSLLVAFVTRQPPSPRLRELANRILAYRYRIGRYLTYNESRVPFPFSDFPDALEEEAWRPSETESKALGLPPREPYEAREDLDEEP